MIFVPDRVIYPEINELVDLEWPRDKWRIAFLSQGQKEAWFASRLPLDLIYESNEFFKWWEKVYIVPLKIKRFFYGFKFW